jgi:hypothetical protein
MKMELVYISKININLKIVIMSSKSYYVDSHARHIPILWYSKHFFSLVLQVILLFTKILLKVTPDDPTGKTAVNIVNGLVHLRY